MQQKNIDLKAFSSIQINFGRKMTLILCLVIYLLQVGTGQFQGMDEEMMKKMGELYGFPYGVNQGQQLPGQGPPSEGDAQPGQRSERQGQGQYIPNQGQWPSQGGSSGNNQGRNQGWPSSNQGQGQPWPDQGQPWPDQGKSQPGQGQQPQNGQTGSVPGKTSRGPGSSLDQPPGATGDQPRGPAGGNTVNTGPAGQGSPDSNNYNMDHRGLTDDKHHQHGSLEELHPRAPKPKRDYIVKLYNGSIHSRHPCHLHPWSAELHHDIRTKVTEGAKLIKFNILFPEYSRGEITRSIGHPVPPNPLNYNLNRTFRANIWQRTYSKHGKTLLALAFNYDILSLKMLQFGVEEMNVNVVDAPVGCFQFLDESERIKIAMDLVLADFNFAEDFEPYLGLTEDDSACYKVIREDSDGYGEFKHRCCGINQDTGRIDCTEDLAVKWIDTLYVLIAACRVASLLFAPLFLQWFAYSESIQKTDYIIRLKDYLTKTLLVKRVRLPGNDQSYNKEDRRFAKFRKVVKTVPSDEIVHVRFRKLQIEVDHRRLMTENSVPVGLFHFLYEYVFRCKIRRVEPFLSCCKESIFGSWSPRFLWLKMRKSSECNVSCKKCCSWAHLANLLGGLLLLAAIPLPYYIRVWVFYEYEEPEVDARKNVLDDLGLKLRYQHNLIHYLGPAHGLMILIYIMYVLSFLFLAALRHCNANKFDNIAVQAVQDLRSISRCECFRLIFAHILLPFEKFGICGILVGLVYWPIVLPICITISIFYCVPTLYLLGRLLIQQRPSCLKAYPLPSSPRRRKQGTKRTLSEGTSSFETCMLLDNISPELHQSVTRKNSRKQKKPKLCGFNRQAIHTAGLSLFVGILCVLFMFSVLILFTEVFGFLIEVCVFTLMGAIVNASSAAKYIMLFFWVIVYSTTCFNSVYNRYMDLNTKVFEMIKEKLKEDVEDVTILRESKQKNTAFKYFTKEEVQSHKDREAELESASEDESGDVEKRDLVQETMAPIDSIEYICDQLHWRLNHLILFVNRKDMPHIPKELFERICKIEAPGCPGPVYKSLLRACRKFLYMVVFLIFVVIVVMAFGDVYKISTTNQLLVTLAGGFLPFVVRFVLRAKQEELSLNTYSFEGKIHHIIDTFTQVWPVFDLNFDIIRTEGHEPDITTRPGYMSQHSQPPGGGAVGGVTEGQTVLPGDQNDAIITQIGRTMRTYQMPRRTEPSQVDLLITIRDDSEDDITGNLRAEAPSGGNYGSHGSLTSGGNMRVSPDEGATNATNARILARQIAAAQAAQQQQLQQQHPHHVQAARPHHAQAAAALNTLISSTAAPTPASDTATASPPVRRTVSYDATADGAGGSGGGRPCSPGRRPVDLMVDMVRGGVLVRNPMDGVEEPSDLAAPGAGGAGGAAGGQPGNGTLAMWSRSSPYKKLPSKEGESCV